MEHLLHYVWKHKLFPLKMMQTTSGLPIEVIDSGLHNSDAGPDFFNAKLKIDGTLWVGNIEIHTLSSDWYRHGHDKDRAYDSVILHVTATPDAEILCSNGQTIPQLQLTCPDYVREHYLALCKADGYPPCHPVFPVLSKLTVHSWFSALQTERLQQKANAITLRLERCGQQWEDAFFTTLARNYGFGLNGEVFEAWAHRLPYRSIDKHRDDLFQIEAFFFGQAGLLEEAFLPPKQEDDYYLRLQKEFHYLQHKFTLPQPMDAALWRFLRLRPENFPYIRLAQLAYLYQKGATLFSRVMEAKTLKEIRELLSTRTSEYWETHFVLGKPSGHKLKTMGEKSLNLLIINTVVPFLYAYGRHKADEQTTDRALHFLEELKAEDNHVIRMWKNAGLSVATAADSQALIQLQKEYCEKRKCLYCRFGYEYLKRP